MAESLAQRVERLERLIHGEEVAPIENFITVTPSGGTASELGMKWQGQWDRESGYTLEDVVRFKGKSYVNIQAVPAIVGITGLGPQPGAFKINNWFFPGGRVKPMGRIAPGEAFGGLLTKTDPKFEEYNVIVEDPEHPGPPFFVAHVWEFWVPESEKKTRIINFGVHTGHGEFNVKGIVHATIGDDGAFNPTSSMTNEAGELTAAKMILDKATAFKEGGHERYYLIVYGGTWQEDKPLPEQKLHNDLPLPYELIPDAGVIVEGPGNINPSVDLEHWEVLDENAAAEGGTSTVNPTSVYDTVTLPNKAPGAIEKIAVATVEEDKNAWWDSEHKRYNPRTAGWYAIHAYYTDTVAALPAGGVVDIGVSMNGTGTLPNYAASTARLESSNGTYGIQGGGTWYAKANGTTDYFEVYGNSSDAGRKGRVKLVAYPLG